MKEFSYCKVLCESQLLLTVAICREDQIFEEFAVGKVDSASQCEI